MGGPLSSSSSGHNMHENETQNQQNSSNQAQNHQATGGKSSKSASATTSPIKDTIRGSQEMIKKLMSSKDRSGLSSSSSEKVRIILRFLSNFLKKLCHGGISKIS